jgi:hypothetical protein
MNNKDHVRIYFEDLTFNSSYEILEEGKEKDKLKEILSKKGMQYSEHDFAFFKCKYAMVDERNLNGCILPRKEVKKALGTLAGKPIDKDHLRKSTIGFWLEGSLEEDDIIAYGCFWKSNFPEDYDTVKEKMKNKELCVSFEAWGNREFIDDKTYNLRDCEFAGGALLFDTKPAFPDAEVLEFSKKRGKVLEFAKIMEEEGKEEMEEAKLSFNYDNETIARILYETECPSCKMKGWHDIQMIDFENSKVKSRCPACQGINMYDLMPTSTIVKKGKKLEGSSFEDYEDTEEKIEMCYAYQLEGSDFVDEDGKVIEKAKKLSYKERQELSDEHFAIATFVTSKKDKTKKKVRVYPIQDECNIKNALSRLNKASETLKKLEVSADEVIKKILNRAKELKMTDLLKRHQEGGTEVNELLAKYNKASAEELIKFIDEVSASVTAKDTELASLKKEVEDSKLKIENSNLELEKVKNEAKIVKDQLDAKITAEKAAIVESRRKDLDEEFNKAMTDDDIMNDLKFENAKLKKALKDNKVEVASIQGLEGGQKITVKEETMFTEQKSIHDKAFKE